MHVREGENRRTHANGGESSMHVCLMCMPYMYALYVCLIYTGLQSSMHGTFARVSLWSPVPPFCPCWGRMWRDILLPIQPQRLAGMHARMHARAHVNKAHI